jgi:hypothetical protein
VITFCVLELALALKVFLAHCLTCISFAVYGNKNMEWLSSAMSLFLNKWKYGDTRICHGIHRIQNSIIRSSGKN